MSNGKYLEITPQMKIPIYGSPGKQYDLSLAPFSKASLGAQKLLFGPNPLTAMALSGILLGGGGYGVGKFLSWLFPEHIREDAGKVYSIIGALLGTALSGVLHAYPGIKRHGLSGLIQPSPLQQALLDSMNKQSSVDAKIFKWGQFQGGTGATFAPDIDAAEWNKMILNDPFIPDADKLTIAGLPLAAAAQKGDKWVSISDIGRIASQVGMGYAKGKMLGAVAGPILRLRPDTKNKIQQVGALAGLLKSVGLF